MRRPAILSFFVLLAAALPATALAQLGGSGAGVASGPGAPQPRVAAPDFAPPAVPGAGGSTLNTSLPVPKVDTGDPTTELFAAVNGGDYNAAEDAVSRGADINAQNPLGETPLDLSIALNRNTITFMLLSARNESAETGGGPATATAPVSATPLPAGPRRRHVRFHPTPAGILTPAAPVPMPVTAAGDNPGTPNPAAGFLGFGH